MIRENELLHRGSEYPVTRFCRLVAGMITLCMLLNGIRPGTIFEIRVNAALSRAATTEMALMKVLTLQNLASRIAGYLLAKLPDQRRQCPPNRDRLTSAAQSCTIVSFEKRMMTGGDIPQSDRERSVFAVLLNTDPAAGTSAGTDFAGGWLLCLLLSLICMVMLPRGGIDDASSPVAPLCNDITIQPILCGLDFLLITIDDKVTGGKRQ
jgi:hypothetical protein